MTTVLACGFPVFQAFAQAPAAPRLNAPDPTVVIPVIVRDRQDQPVTGLDQDAFVVREGNRILPIMHFSLESGPVGLVLVVDASASVSATALSNVQEVVRRIVQSTHPDSEYVIIGLAAKVWSAGWTSDRGLVLRAVDELTQLRSAPGPTPLHDGVLRGFAAADQSRFRKRAVIIVSDGMDTNSRATLDDAEAALRRTSAVVYSLVMKSNLPGPTRFGLMRLADVTAGRAFNVGSPSDWTQASERIVSDLQHLYLIGVSPDVSRRGWRSVTVALASPPAPGVTVRSRVGYLARRP